LGHDSLPPKAAIEGIAWDGGAAGGVGEVE
jgi:hypothetical protein